MNTQISALGVSAGSISSMDLETMMMFVQSQRANMLEDQLKQQLEEVQDKNLQVSKLNTVMGEVNGMLARFDGGGKLDGSLESTGKPLGPGGISDVNTILKAAGVTAAELFSKDPNTTVNLDHLTKAEIDAGLTKLKNKIDSLGTSQQSDMLRLQGLSNKRNEAFEIMTSFMKKLQDGLNSIISNFRS